MNVEIPIEYVKDYYGPSVAFYFEFVGFFAKGLLPLGVVGVMIAFMAFGSDFVINDSSRKWDIPKVGYFCYSCICSLWTSLFLSYWRRNESYLRKGAGNNTAEF